MNHFTTTLNRLHGPLHKYWRIGTTSGSSGTSYWPMMRERGCMAVGWSKVGDLSWVDGKNPTNEKLKALLTKEYPGDPAAIGRSRSQLAQFVARLNEGDIVLAADGAKILGVGKVTGAYTYVPESEFAHQRPVDWQIVEAWKLPESGEGLQSSVRELGKHDENLLAIEQRIQSVARAQPEPRPIRLAGIPARIQSVLERKGQVVLYGPPGTGKTYWAERTANDLASVSAFGKRFEDLDVEKQKIVTGGVHEAGLVRLCCFHPGYGYEDFIEGYRPRTIDGHIAFDLRDGVFKKICRDAAASPDRNFYLIVDEINRGDIPRIFGELLTILEKDKRGKHIILPVSQEHFQVPRNVFLIGTMNTADRSISLLDAALRRRFGFVELMPESDVLKDSSVSGIALKAWLDALNGKIREFVGRDARNLQIGHSYLMHSGTPLKDLATFKRTIRDDVIPLLEEYCYEDFDTLGKILGDDLVDVSGARIRHDLFDEGQEDAFIQALLAPFPEISNSSEAIASDESQAELDEADDEDER